VSKIFKFCLAILTIFVLSVLLTPPLARILHPYFRFEKIFDRLVMIFGVSAAFLFVILPKIQKDGTKALLGLELWRSYGFDFSESWKKLLAYGFLGGAVTVALMAVVEVAFGPNYVRHPFLVQDIIERFFKGLLSGTIVGVVEEFFFRGFIFLNLRRKLNVWVSVILASVFYSLSHFFDNGRIFIPQNPTVRDALRLLVGYLEPIAWHPSAVLPQFVGLFLFGIILNIAFVRTRSLLFSIGVHAGAVFIIKFQYSFVRQGLEVYHPFFGANPYYDGPVEWLFLILLGSVIWLRTKNFLQKNN